MRELKTCSVCGATELKRIDFEEHDGQVFAIYKCPACDTEFSAYHKYLSGLRKKAISSPDCDKATNKSWCPSVENSGGIKVVVNIAADVYKKAVGSTIELDAQMHDSSICGTGTVVSKNGYFITNAHVVAEIDKNQSDVAHLCEEVYGKGGERGYRFTADLIYANPVLDLALLKTDPCDSLIPVTYSKSDAFIGESVYAIGNSKGEGLCIVEGIVSDVHRKIGNNDVIMISAPVTTGNSGGPVFNSDGELIGIVQSGRKGVSAMNYVIPTKTIIDFLREAKDKENCDFEL